MRSMIVAIAVCLVMSNASLAHDTWVQTNTNLVRTGDAVHIDLMLGNHGNNHRDFKLASKLTFEAIQNFEIVAPDGKKFDLKQDIIDLGYAPKEGYYSTRFVAGKPGMYIAAHSSDRIVNHGKPLRAYRSAKAYFAASDSLDNPRNNLIGFDKPLGHRLELVAVTNPVTPMGPGMPIKLRLLFEGKPLARQMVTFIPRGVTLKDGIDTEHEHTTNENGEVTYTPKVGTYYLVVVHYPLEENGEEYEAARCTATLSFFVPQICPCCDE